MRQYFIIIFTLVSLSLFAQSTRIECLTVRENDGAVSLRFSGPSGTDFFKIYRANQLNGTYSLIFTTTSGILTTYLDNTVNAASASFAYYIESFDNNQLTGESAKVRTILLTVNSLNNGLVSLSWNDVGVPVAYDYQIWINEENTFFVIHSFTNQTSYIDTLEGCQANLNYQIRVPMETCEFISNVRGGTFADITQPENIVPRNATIDTATGNIRLSWLLPSAESDDIAKYQIWIINQDGGSTSFPAIEVNGYLNLSTTINSEIVCDTVVTLAITAQDMCGNSSNYSNQAYHIRTVNMHHPLYNICNDECLVTWDSLWSWYNVPVAGVRIYQRRKSEPFEVVAQVSGTDVSAVLQGFERDVLYDFYIEAFNADNTIKSTSCIKSIRGRKPLVSEYCWLRRASVIDGEVHLKWQVDSIGFIPQYAIARSGDNSSFSFIDTIQGNNDTVQSFIDIKSYYYQSPQFYKIYPFDSCFNMGEPSNIAATIYSQVESFADGEALVEWTPYQTMDSLLSYQIYRVIDTLIYPFPIGEVNPESELRFVDNYSSSVPATAKLGYFVEAVGYLNNQIFEADSSRSNTNYLAKVTNVFIPTAFRPQGGVSRIYKPITTGISSNNYSFQILNKWGMVIFETHQPTLGWDGKYQGAYVMTGAYVYVVIYESLYGKKSQQSGVFFVL